MSEERKLPGLTPAILCMAFLGAGAYARLMLDAAQAQDETMIEVLLYVVGPLAILGAVICAGLALWLVRRARKRQRAAKLAQRGGEPTPEPRDVAAGLVVQAIHALLPIGDLARDVTAARKLGDAVTLLEGAAALLAKDDDGGAE